MLFEYTKVGNSYIITDFKDIEPSEIKLVFLPEQISELRLGDVILAPSGRYATVKASLFTDGIYTPIARTADGCELICEGIKCLAGILSPAMSAEERSILLSKKITLLEQEEKNRKAALASLYDAVFGKTIF